MAINRQVVIKKASYVDTPSLALFLQVNLVNVSRKKYLHGACVRRRAYLFTKCFLVVLGLCKQGNAFHLTIFSVNCIFENLTISAASMHILYSLTFITDPRHTKQGPLIYFRVRAFIYTFLKGHCFRMWN